MKSEDNFVTKNYRSEDDYCDLDPSKICDNCCKCLELDEREYNTVLADFLYEDTLVEDISSKPAPSTVPHIRIYTIHAAAKRRSE